MDKLNKKILDKYQVRKTKAQKMRFIDLLIKMLPGYGYNPIIHTRGNNKNIIIGDVKKAKIIITAHYDTAVEIPFSFKGQGSLYAKIKTCFLELLLALLFLFFMFINYLWVKILAEYVFGFIILNFLKSLNVTEFKELLKAIYIIIAIVITIKYLRNGKANKHTANDNTSGVITILEAAIKLPQELRDQVCFVLFDNEEKGLKGSKAFKKDYRKIIKRKIIINFDCVSDGDYIFIIPSKGVKGNKDLYRLINASFQGSGNKEIYIDEKKDLESDNKRFKKNSFGVLAQKKKGNYYYFDRIHTRRDTIFDEKNIKLLSDGICRMVALSLQEEFKF